MASAFVAGVLGRGEPGPLQPRRRRHADASATWPRARLVLDPDPGAGGGRHRRGDSAPTRLPTPAGLDPLGAQAGADEDGPREEAS